MVVEQLITKSGYKQTETGIIPQDWEVRKLGHIADIKTGPFGSSLHQSDYVKSGTPIVTVEHLRENGIIHQNLPLVSEQDKKRLNGFQLKENDIVFSRVGSVDRNSLITKKENGWLFSGRLLRIRIETRDINPKFLSYFLHHEPTKQRIRIVAVGQTMPSLNTQILKDFDVAFPKKNKEQVIISEILANIDKLIDQTKKIITKKKNIKQGTTQELLSGKRKLSGFDEGWESINLDENGIFLKGKGLSKKEMSRYGIWKAIPYTSIFTDYNEVIDNNEINQFTSSKNILMINSPHLLIAGSSNMLENVGKITAYDSNEYVAVGGDIILFKTRLNVSFLSYLLNTKKHRNKIISLSQGSTIRHVYGSTFEKYEIELPKSNMEQETIAKILLTMDLEIKKLENLKSKYISSKNGMMQKLLTGEIRLV